ncbi:MAG TPA: ATP-binding cassette domain-containing protein [Bacteroidales bacterium]|nr:ATP-binding cassette domain-containing protein [Bacteroidales bacterium]
MSEKILEALMQLFAIIARPESSAADRRAIVEYFLIKQLNKELAEEFLKIYDSYVKKFAEEDAKKSQNSDRILARRSVRVLKICTNINEVLIQQQKVVFLIQLLEFIKSDSETATDQEMEYVTTVSDTFNIDQKEYEAIREFVLNDKELAPSSHFLIVDNTDDGRNIPAGVKHIKRNNLSGQVRVLHILSTNLYFVKYIGQAELYINGQLLEQYKTYPLNTGASIRNQQIIPIYYSDIVSSFVEDRIKSKIVFQADHVGFKFPNGAIGLHDIGFTETSGRLVGIMGASGAGKSTLLNVLNGTNKPTSGSVSINGIDIHGDDPDMEGIIGFVSQDDLLIEELSVYQNLYYNAKLCFDNYSEQEIEETVIRVLKNLGLYEIREIQVGSPLNKKISGGQRKRLNIALELIREPAVLFLDEPTSGLSSRDSENILDLLKELSLKGKLVFVVIHQPSSDIFKMFDRLLILDTGGYLIYNGNPIDSIEYFKSRMHHADWNESECPKCGNVNPEQVFNIVETSVLDEYGKLTHTRRVSPKQWSDYFRKEYKESKKPKADKTDLPEISFKTPNQFKQFLVFLKRDILKKLSDIQYLTINFLEAPILALGLAFIVKYYDVNVTNQFNYNLLENSNLPVYIFMSVIVAIFMGLSVSAEEIIKDRKILKREAFLNLSWSGYLFSKVAVQFMLSAIQAATFVLIGNSIMEIKGMYFEYWLVLFSSWAAANVMGLLISDSFKTVVTIYILIPFLVIPQIILSGIIVKFENLNPTISAPDRIPIYGEIITARWAYEALATYQFTNNAYQENFYLAEKKKSVSEFYSNYLLKNLQNKLNAVESNYTNPEQEEMVRQHLQLIRNELKKEHEARKVFRTYAEDMPGYRIKDLESITLEKLDAEKINYVNDYITSLMDAYTNIYRSAFRESDQIKQTYDLEELQKLKRDYHNASLEEFVTNKNEFDKIIEYNGKLIQKSNPIYLDPTNNFVKAHFYAPRKLVFGQFVDTIWVNTVVIWMMTIIMFIMLYYRVLKRLLDFFENLTR